MEDRYIFNPYGFGGPFGPNFPPNMMPPPNIASNVDNKITAKDFYESQYYYYRHLNEAMQYQIKSQELAEKMNKLNSKQNNSNI